MPTFARVIPLLVYQDLQAAHDFLVEAFGFQAGGVERNGDGQPVHGEVRAGDTTICLHRVTTEHRLDSPLSANVANCRLVVHVDDVDRHYELARSAGAHYESVPADKPYGQLDYGL